MKINTRFLIGLTLAVGLAVAVCAVRVVHAQKASIQQRTPAPTESVVTEPAAPGTQACDSSFLTLPDGTTTSSGLTATIFVSGLPGTTAVPVVVNFSTEIHSAPGGFVNLDYVIDGAFVGAVGPEFFVANEQQFVTRTATGVIMPPFPFGSGMALGPGLHTITPVLTAFGGGGVDGAAFFRCFWANP